MEQGRGNTPAPLLATTVSGCVSSEEQNLSLPVMTNADSQRSFSGIPSTTPSPVLSPQGKLFGRNLNGTMVSTSTPNNEAELQLYRVLQRASLLAYYDTLLEMGGDDVQQLCDAGEEEFLEIMALVGMASKPLHVRRLQKALHEWVTNPSTFQAPIPNTGFVDYNNQTLHSPDQSTPRSKLSIALSYNPTPLLNTTLTSSNVVSNPNISPFVSGLPSQVTSSSPQLTPILTESQVARIACGAEKIAKQIPQREPRIQSLKKRANRELEQVIAMSESNPGRMDEIRKYSAIYGRFDCKRRPEKPLTLHEVCVNEAAAQLCKLVPALLTRRDELFPLARQIVKDAGFGHSAGMVRFVSNPSSSEVKVDETIAINTKRQRLTSSDHTPVEYKDPPDDSRYNLFAMYHKFARPSFEMADVTKFALTKSDYDDNDSRFSFSNSNSPPRPVASVSTVDADVGHTENLYDNGNEEVSLKSSIDCPLNVKMSPSSPIACQVLSASGGHIIAVANPALAMSPALSDTLNIKFEATSPSNE